MIFGITEKWYNVLLATATNIPQWLLHRTLCSWMFTTAQFRSINMTRQVTHGCWSGLCGPRPSWRDSWRIHRPLPPRAEPAAGDTPPQPVVTAGESCTDAPAHTERDKHSSTTCAIHRLTNTYSLLYGGQSWLDYLLIIICDWFQITWHNALGNYLLILSFITLI